MPRAAASRSADSARSPVSITTRADAHAGPAGPAASRACGRGVSTSVMVPASGAVHAHEHGGCRCRRRRVASGTCDAVLGPSARHCRPAPAAVHHGPRPAPGQRRELRGVGPDQPAVPRRPARWRGPADAPIALRRRRPSAARRRSSSRVRGRTSPRLRLPQRQRPCLVERHGVHRGQPLQHHAALDQHAAPRRGRERRHDRHRRRDRRARTGRR